LASATLESACREDTAPDAMKQLLDKVAAALAQMLAGLSLLEQPETSTQTQAKDPEKRNALLTRLRVLLEDDDTAAVDVVEELEALAGSEDQPGTLKRLTAAIGEYDFEEALKALAELEIGRSSNG